MKKLFILIVYIIINSSLSYSQTGWQVQNTPVGSYFNTIFFLNENTGWAATVGVMNGIIIKTTNRGINWITLTDSLNVSWVTDI